MPNTGKFVSYTPNSRIFFGDHSLIGEQHNTSHVIANPDTTWVSIVGAGDRKLQFQTSLSYMSYQYNNNSETLIAKFNTDDSQPSPFTNNIKNMRPSTYLYHHPSTGSFPEWVKYKSSYSERNSYTALSIMKLSDSIKGQNMIFHTFLERDVTASIINSKISNLHEKTHHNFLKNCSSTATNFKLSEDRNIMTKFCLERVNGFLVYNERIQNTKLSDQYGIYRQMPHVWISNVKNPSVSIYSHVPSHEFSKVYVNVRGTGEYITLEIDTFCKQQSHYFQYGPPSGWSRWNAWFHTPEGTHEGVSYRDGFERIDDKRYKSCTATWYQVQVFDKEPYDTVIKHDIKKHCLQYDSNWQCIKRNERADSMHIENTVLIPSENTNYLLIESNMYDLSNYRLSNTILNANHIFAQMNKHYAQTNDVNKKLVGGVAEANVFLLPVQSGSTPLLHITSLPPNISYDIKQGDNILVTGFTSNSGEIELHTNNINNNNDLNEEILLSIYPNSGVYQGTIIQDDTNAITYDPRNKQFINVNGPDNKIHTTEGYIRYTIPSTVNINNVTLHKGDETISLDYLNKQYKAGSKMYVPIVPGYLTITMDINGVFAKFYVLDLLPDSVNVPKTSNSGTGEKSVQINTTNRIIATEKNQHVYLTFTISAVGHANYEYDVTSTLCHNTYGGNVKVNQISNFYYGNPSVYIQNPSYYSHDISYNINNKSPTIITQADGGNLINHGLNLDPFIEGKMSYPSNPIMKRDGTGSTSSYFDNTYTHKIQLDTNPGDIVTFNIENTFEKGRDSAYFGLISCKWGGTTTFTTNQVQITSEQYSTSIEIKDFKLSFEPFS